DQAGEMLRAEGIEDRLETKPRSIAVHWRGLEPDDRAQVYLAAMRVFELFSGEGTRIMQFDGGVELVMGQQDKGDAVRAVLREAPQDCSVAYLGDDVTDEDAFRAIQGIGLGVLVRDCFRPTEATCWLRPPDELIEFLTGWELACRRAA